MITITKINEKNYNILKDNQTITLSWANILDILDIAIYGEPGERRTITETGNKTTDIYYTKYEKNNLIEP